MHGSTRLNIHLTHDGRQALNDELARLRADLPVLAARIGAARDDAADPVENLGLRDALDALSELETRIAQRQAVLAAAEPLDEGPDRDGRVRIGARVAVRDSSGEVYAYVLVSPPEADPRRGRISGECPVGRALIGARFGDTVIAETPGGREPLVILDVS
jgi:transcription elongation factor GreA